MARHLESLGHDVIVADPNFASMYATRTRRVKTDRRDARTLAERIALRRGRWVASVALTRRLAGMLYAMWRDEQAYRLPPAGLGAAVA